MSGPGTVPDETSDREVTVVEPLQLCVRSVLQAQCGAGDLCRARPFEDQSFDAAMAFATRSASWQDPIAGWRCGRSGSPRGGVHVRTTDRSWRRRFWRPATTCLRSPPPALASLPSPPRDWSADGAGAHSVGSRLTAPRRPALARGPGRENPSRQIGVGQLGRTPSEAVRVPAMDLASSVGRTQPRPPRSRRTAWPSPAIAGPAASAALDDLHASSRSPADGQAISTASGGASLAQVLLTRPARSMRPRGTPSAEWSSATTGSTEGAGCIADHSEYQRGVSDPATPEGGAGQGGRRRRPLFDEDDLAQGGASTAVRRKRLSRTAST